MSENKDNTSLSIGDGIAVVGLLFFIIGWIVLWSVGADLEFNEEDESFVGGMVGITIIFLIIGPPIWAGKLIGRIVKSEKVESDEKVEVPQ